MNDETDPKLMLDTYRHDANEGDLFTDPESGETFAYNGEEWVTTQPPSLEDLTISDVAADQFLFYESDAQPTFTLNYEPTPFMTIYDDGEMMVEINVHDGTVSFGKNYDPEDAARIFWESLAGFSPWKMPAETISEEEYKNQLEQENQYAAMQAAEDMLVFEEQENGEVFSRLNPDYAWDEHIDNVAAMIEDDVEETKDPFDSARGVIE